MRFVIGPKPYAEAFDPAGWTEVSVPRYRLAALLGPVTGLILSSVVVLLLYLLAPRCIGLEGGWRSYSHWQLVLLFLLTIPIHELVHALLQPGFGAQTSFGFWPRRLVFYAFYPAPRTRERVLVGALGPYVVLSILPVFVASLLDLGWWGIGAFTFINAFSSANDVNGFIFVLSRVPRGALVTAQPRSGYWRLRD